MKLIDLVNFNADGSCVSAARWLEALEGGAGSLLCRWLGNYVEFGRKVCIGWVGASLADMRELNSEALDLLNAHPEIFEAVLRPFSHDVSLLRTSAGFRRNAELGIQATHRELDNVVRWYLPPEFMLTSMGVHDLVQLGVEGVFINSARFGPELASRIPADPYVLRGVLESALICIPIRGDLTAAWLEAMHRFEPEPWNGVLERSESDVVVSWRDGETFLFLPEGLEREREWLARETRSVERIHLSEYRESAFFGPEPAPERTALRSYPPHSFTEWFRESRMLGFLRRVERAEERLASFSIDELTLWLQVINSDVLSAVEKDSPRVPLRARALGAKEEEVLLLRSERGFEGEDFLARLERAGEGCANRADAPGANSPHLRKLSTRAAYLGRLLGA